MISRALRSGTGLVLAAGLMAAMPAMAQGAPAAQEQQEGQAAADASLAAQDWAAAIPAYQALLKASPDNGGNWLRLARALHGNMQHEAAITAYRKAIALKAQPEQRARFGLARALLTQGERDQALDEIEAIAALGGMTPRLFSITPEYAPLAGDARYEAAMVTLNPCTPDEHRGFDFWLGEWDVAANGSPVPTASSSITAKHGGCVVLEQYDAGGYTGMSINFYDVTSKLWHQTWMSNTNVPVYLEGGLNADGAMVLSDDALPISKATGTINRVTWSENGDGSVRQHWETSSDNGATWSTAFDGRYTRKAEAD
ncbi:MAG: hypothetical protein R3E02_07120 [Blastomonas sp.]